MKNSGKKRVKWAQEHMPVLAEIRRQLKKDQPFQDLVISMALHVEPKTAVLALTLKDGGAEVYLTSCNPLSTQDDTVAYLKKSLPVYAKKGETEKELFAGYEAVLDKGPNIVIDDGSDMIALLHKPNRKDQISDILGASEETTTGIQRLRALEKQGKLLFPVMATNNAVMKHFFDNRYGTGQSTIDGILTGTNLTIAGKTAVVCGYGWCGRGIATRMRGMGANVIVTEVNPVKAIEALHDGFRVMPTTEAARQADFIITSTGNKGVIDAEALKNAKGGCILANSGHFNVEIDIHALEKMSEKTEREVRELVDAYYLKDGRIIYLLGEGRLVNLAVGQGHPAEIMDMSFSLQALAALYLAEHKGEMKNEVYEIPYALDSMVAKLKLKAMGVEIDELTEEQRKYIESWEL
jgi:adenosylhomocysteinase